MSKSCFFVTCGTKENSILLYDKEGEEQCVNSDSIGHGKLDCDDDVSLARFATGGKDNVLKVWSVLEHDESKEKQVRPFKIKRKMSRRGHSDWISCLSARGEFLASGSWDMTLRLWKVKEMKCQGVVSKGKHAHMDSIASLFFLEDNLLCSGSYDRTIKVWDLEKIAHLRTIKDFNNSIYSLCYCPGWNIFAGCSLDKTIRLYDQKNFRCTAVLSNPNAATTSKNNANPLSIVRVCYFSPRSGSSTPQHLSEAQIIAGDASGNIFCFDLRKPKEAVWNEKKIHGAPTRGLQQFTRKTLLVAAEDGCVKFVEVKSGEVRVRGKIKQKSSLNALCVLKQFKKESAQ